MAEPARFFSGLSALLFLAASAWVGAGLYSRAESPASVTAQYVTVEDSAQLRGIALRREQELTLERGFAFTADNGKRLAAGDEIARNREGFALCCKSPALFFSHCDGYEHLSPDGLSTMDCQGLLALLSSRPKVAGEARLVGDNAWYFAAFVRWSEALPEGGLCLVQFEGFDAPAQAQVLRLSPPEQGKSLMLLRLTAGGEDYLSLRKTEARLVFSRYSGLKVPDSAIHTADDGSKFVYTLSAGALKETAVDIIYSGGDFALVCAGEPGALREGSRVLSS